MSPGPVTSPGDGVQVLVLDLVVRGRVLVRTLNLPTRSCSWS